ncbi:MAG TPA: response regulator [Acidimicrobiales bacterium]|nr:response regulator [Acidimicrobiales bacterium]HXB36862.1 response regulator [Acidimicrobiales bacterium]
MNSVLLADVLVVDDEEPIRTSVAQILRSAGYSVAEAADGQDALDMLESGSVSVLLLDIRMPRRTGIEVLQALDSPPNVILMSAYRFEGEDKRSVGHKVFSHLMKPVAPRQLLDEVRAAIDREDA